MKILKTGNIFKTGAFIIALLLPLNFAIAGQLGSGSFTGASGHKTTGQVSVSQSGGKITVTLGKSFFLDGAPDPYVALGNGSKPVSGGILQILKNNKGGQTYTASITGIDLARVNSVVIWCKKYAVPLGVAKIK